MVLRKKHDAFVLVWYTPLRTLWCWDTLFRGIFYVTLCGLKWLSQVVPNQEQTVKVSEPHFQLIAWLTSSQTMQPSPTGMVFLWKKSIYSKKSLWDKTCFEGGKIKERKRARISTLLRSTSWIWVFLESNVSRWLLPLFWKGKCVVKPNEKLKKQKLKQKPSSHPCNFSFFCFRSRRWLNLPGFCSILEWKTS